MYCAHTKTAYIAILQYCFTNLKLLYRIKGGNKLILLYFSQRDFIHIKQGRYSTKEANVIPFKPRGFRLVANISECEA